MYASEGNVNSVWNVGCNPKYYHRTNKCKVGYKSLRCSATQWLSHNTNNLISPISRYSHVTIEMHKSSLSVQHKHSGPVSSREGFVLVPPENAKICSVSFRSPPITGCNVLTTDRALLTDLHNTIQTMNTLQFTQKYLNATWNALFKDQLPNECKLKPCLTLSGAIFVRLRNECVSVKKRQQTFRSAAGPDNNLAVTWN